jgi:hypothetical protein
MCDRIEIGYLFPYVPDKFKTEELCLKAVKRNPLNFEYVPIKQQTYVVCYEAVKRNCNLIHNIEDPILQQRIKLDLI